MKFINKYRTITPLNLENRGFTLLELMVVILIISILGAIALPTLLANIGKSRESEATINLATLSRSQQGYHLENREFADTMNKLSSSVALVSEYYNFPDPTSISATLVKHQAVPLNVGINQIRNYSAGTYFDPSNANYTIVICQGNGINSMVDTPNTSTGSCTNNGKKIK